MTTNTTLYLSNTGHFDFAEVFAGKTILRQGKEWLTTHRLKQQIQKERRELEQLPEELLHDIGVSRADAEREAKRGFHDIPVERCNRCRSRS